MYIKCTFALNELQYDTFKRSIALLLNIYIYIFKHAAEEVNAKLLELQTQSTDFQYRMT